MPNTVSAFARDSIDQMPALDHRVRLRQLAARRFDGVSHFSGGGSDALGIVFGRLAHALGGEHAALLLAQLARVQREDAQAA